ncbi:MAG: hypothetical protein JXR88_02470 [Clostridia bacterium]|nr:hypothetical protein [Clostridia bacterium]
MRILTPLAVFLVFVVLFFTFQAFNHEEIVYSVTFDYDFNAVEQSDSNLQIFRLSIENQSEYPLTFSEGNFYQYTISKGEAIIVEGKHPSEVKLYSKATHVSEIEMHLDPGTYTLQLHLLSDEGYEKYLKENFVIK